MGLEKPIPTEYMFLLCHGMRICSRIGDLQCYSPMHKSICNLCSKWLKYYLSPFRNIRFGWLLPKQYGFDPLPRWFSHCKKASTRNHEKLNPTLCVFFMWEQLIHRKWYTVMLKIHNAMQYHWTKYDHRVNFRTHFWRNVTSYWVEATTIYYVVSKQLKQNIKKRLLVDPKQLIKARRSPQLTN